MPEGDREIYPSGRRFGTKQRMTTLQTGENRSVAQIVKAEIVDLFQVA